MVYIGIDSGHLRAAFRIYFIVVLTVLGLVGSQACKCAAKLDLINGRTVKLHKMTGWVRARDVLTCVWKLRRLPGGWWLGFMMVIASLLTLVADLAVSLFVKQTMHWDVCRFDQGLVMDWQPHSETFSSPPSNGYPALVAMNAQISAVLNGCASGIYNKVPQEDDSQLCPHDEEILGTWQCNDLQRDAIIPSAYTVDDIGVYLYNNSLQYQPYPAFTSITNKNNGSTHYAAWSPSNVYSDTPSTFTVLASIDLNATITDTKTIRTYNCTISPDSNNVAAVEAILGQMDSPQALLDWQTKLEGAVYLGAGSNADANADTEIAQLLNSLTMVQGGSNSVFSTGNEPFLYGCTLLKTTVSPGVFILAGFAALILLITTFYWLFLVIRLGKHALPELFHRHDTGTRNLKPVPDSILSWMLQASRENALSGNFTEAHDTNYLIGIPRKEEELLNWSFAVTDAKNGVARMVRAEGTAAPQTQPMYMSVDQI